MIWIGLGPSIPEISSRMLHYYYDTPMHPLLRITNISNVVLSPVLAMTYTCVGSVCYHICKDISYPIVGALTTKVGPKSMRGYCNVIAP